MNKIIILLAFVVFGTTISFAQTELYRAKLKKEQIPAVVITSVTTDFPEATAAEYGAIPITIVDEKIYITANEGSLEEDYDTYVVTLKGKNGFMNATYNAEGELISTSAKMKDVPLPHAVQLSIGRHFPGWTVHKDKMVMTSIENGKQKTHYKVKLTKEKENHRVIFDGDGNIIKGAGKAKKHHLINFASKEDREMRRVERQANRMDRKEMKKEFKD